MSITWPSSSDLPAFREDPQKAFELLQRHIVRGGNRVMGGGVAGVVFVLGDGQAVRQLGSGGDQVIQPLLAWWDALPVEGTQAARAFLDEHPFIMNSSSTKE